MRTLSYAWLLAVLGACANEPTTSLAQLGEKYGAPNIEIVANTGQVNIEMHVAETSGCPQLADDVVATFDGQTMLVARGGYDTDSSGCYPIAFWFNSTPMAASLGFEAERQSSQLVVTDPTATWQITTAKLLSNDFVVDAASSTIVWEDVTAITGAEVVPSAVTSIVGNTINVVPGTTVQSVEAYAHPVATQCDGPALCLVDVDASRTWNGGEPL
jgi:hypothetical protein